ncbi:MAG: amidase [Rhodospirillaceae bacterium]|jgi:Asp-tRNA(Asn)/Glu-tRNA(Gln) amidotransferase A subunit family amidase|nr:amidase [Rhodospirillaceae bacterium]MBT5013886.1 amidase [Rhodospirillaceae bacterium]MBT6407477.1 amidase [Rhodospirillaceae bacterium]MBT7354792.1 amidase [Rhodospirillaceae bacterium]
MDDAHFLSASDAAQAIDNGELTSDELVRACLDHIVDVEDTIQAWAHIDPNMALAQASELDEWRRLGHPLGPLHGVPIGIKDIIDSAGLPCEFGTEIHAGRKPEQDATLVGLLREAGAVIMGKTVTAELAVLTPGKTHNPHNPDHTPGGSSSGSAASVAAGMVPLAVGTQTNGSMIRPASYCGVYGFKPSYGRISRHGVLQQSHILDTIGVYGRSIDDIALIADVLMTFDAQDPDMRPIARPQVAKILAEEPPMPPRLAFIRTPAWEQADDSTKEAFRELIDHLNEGDETIDLLELSEQFDDVYDVHRRIMLSGLAKNFAREYSDSKDKLSALLCEMIEEGQGVSESDYINDVERIEEYNTILDLIFEDYDAALTPSTTGEAPVGLESTGSPIFCTIWTLCGTPAINLPILQGPNGLPLGVQMVSHKGDDARLLRTAKWLMQRLES